MSRYTLVSLAIALLAIAVIVSSCTPPDTKIEDKRQVDGKRITETMRADNCLGVDVLVQDMPVQKSFHYTVEIMPNPGQALDEPAIREKILEAYEVARMDKDKVCVLPVEVPAGAVYEYDIQWTEIWREGIITLGSGGEQVGTYRILVDLDCQTVGQRVSQCNQ